MADTKLTALAENTTPALTDIVYIVDDPGGTPVSEKITLANLLAAGLAYGDVYTTSGSAAQALTAATPAKLTLFTANGPSSNTTPDHTNDQITAGIAGVYNIYAQFSLTSSANNVVFIFSVALDGVAQAIKSQRKVGTGADVGSCSLAGHLSLSASQVISIIVTADTGTNLTITEAQLTVSKIS